MLEQSFSKLGHTRLEITAGKLTDNMKLAIDDLAFSAVSKERLLPDIMGDVVPEENGLITVDKPQLILAEVKNANIKLKDIFQVKIYCEIFDATYGLLITTKDFPTHLQRLVIARPWIAAYNKETDPHAFIPHMPMQIQICKVRYTREHKQLKILDPKWFTYQNLDTWVDDAAWEPEHYIQGP